MTQAHTPGPWSVSIKGQYVGITHQPTKNNPLGGLVCKMHSGRPEIHADARLIAAAPDLLEALETALTMLDALKVESGRGIEWDEEDAFRMGEWFDVKELDAMKNMRAAIAKAKGGAE